MYVFDIASRIRKLKTKGLFIIFFFFFKETLSIALILIFSIVVEFRNTRAHAFESWPSGHELGLAVGRSWVRAPT